MESRNRKLRILLLLVCLFKCFLRASAETYYSGYALAPGTNLSVDSEPDCIRECLADPTCAAATVCYFPQSFTCQVTNCAFIDLVSLSDCKTIVFLDIKSFGNKNVPIASYEWTLTDECSNINCFANAGLSIGPPITSVTAPQYKPSWGYFFGNAVTSSTLSLTAANITVNINKSVSVFLMIKFREALSDFTLAQINFSSSTDIRFSYSATNDLITFTSSLSTTCSGSACKANSSKLNLVADQWYSLALLYNSRNLKVYLNGNRKMNYTLTASLSSSSSLASLTVGGGDSAASSSSVSVYCYKLYRSLLSQNDVINIAQSCTIGRINTTDITTPNSYSYSGSEYGDSSWMSQFQVSSVTSEGVNVLLFVANGNNSGWNSWNKATQRCQSIMYSLAQLAGQALYTAFQSLVPDNLPILVGAIFDNDYEQAFWSDSSGNSVNLEDPSTVAHEQFAEDVCNCSEWCSLIAYYQSEFYCVRNNAVSSFACTSD